LSVFLGNLEFPLPDAGGRDHGVLNGVTSPPEVPADEYFIRYLRAGADLKGFIVLRGPTGDMNIRLFYLARGRVLFGE